MRNFEQLRSVLDELGCEEVLVKPLAPNDNSKNQPYIAKDKDLLGFSLLPASDFRAEGRNLYAQLDFHWIDDEGKTHLAPGAKLIQYGRYSPPEVRLSGFLRGCSSAPSAVMTVRAEGRVLFMGIAGRRIYAYAAAAGTELAGEALELLESDSAEQRGALFAFQLRAPTEEIVGSIEEKLLHVHSLGWVPGQIMVGGQLAPHFAQNAGGTTLEALLGVSANSEAAPDLLGWEIKAVETKKLNHMPTSKVATLMTPSPDGGIHKSQGAAAFVRRYGYAPDSGDPDRLNFSVVHRVGVPASRTNSTLLLSGYEPGKLPEPEGSVQLVMEDGVIGAEWSFAKLLEHWNRKHAQTVYVPYERDKQSQRYRYSNVALFCRGSTFGRFASALHSQIAYYDPGLNLKFLPDGTAKAHARHQFRMNIRNVSALYESVSSGGIPTLGGRSASE